MKGFRRFLEAGMGVEDAKSPPTPKGDLNIKDHERLLLQTYLDKGELSQADLDDIGKMMSGGWRFHDALSAAMQQANHRKQFQIIHQPGEPRRGNSQPLSS